MVPSPRFMSVSCQSGPNDAVLPSPSQRRAVLSGSVARESSFGSFSFKKRSSGQEALEDAVFRLLLGEAQGLQL